MLSLLDFAIFNNINKILELQWLTPLGNSDHVTANITLCRLQSGVVPRLAKDFNNMNLTKLQAITTEITWDLANGTEVAERWRIIRGVPTNPANVFGPWRCRHRKARATR